MNHLPYKYTIDNTYTIHTSTVYIHNTHQYSVHTYTIHTSTVYIHNTHQYSVHTYTIHTSTVYIHSCFFRGIKLAGDHTENYCVEHTSQANVQLSM